MKQINLRVSEELLTRIDEAAGDVAREVWLRRAVELALGNSPNAFATPAPAEQPGRTKPWSEIRAKRAAMDPEFEAGVAAERERVERELSEAKEPIRPSRLTQGSVPSSEGVRSATPASRQHSPTCRCPICS